MSVLPHFTQDILPSQPHPAPSPRPPRHDASSSHRPDAHEQTQAHRPDTRPLITHKLLPSLCSRGLMGNLLKVLACAELEHGPIVFLDFERETIRCFFSFPPKLFFSYPFSLRCLCFVFTPIPSVLATHCAIFMSLFTPLSPRLFSSSF